MIVLFQTRTNYFHFRETKILFGFLIKKLEQKNQVRLFWKIRKNSRTKRRVYIPTKWSCIEKEKYRLYILKNRQSQILKSKQDGYFVQMSVKVIFEMSNNWSSFY
jgi:hypothetical protein